MKDVLKIALGEELRRKEAFASRASTGELRPAKSLARSSLFVDLLTLRIGAATAEDVISVGKVCYRNLSNRMGISKCLETRPDRTPQNIPFDHQSL